MKDPKIIDIGVPPGSEGEPNRPEFFVPLSSRGVPRWLVLALGVLSFLHILNPTMGIIELIPDNLPIIGNLDEGVAFLLIMYAVRELVDQKSEN
ncbi:MAG: DUF1232 domain-containing protein [Chloroflexi bacterium]|nr:DUF1232 domain-containing protein [Chloroflexota bacterium]